MTHLNEWALRAPIQNKSTVIEPTRKWKGIIQCTRCQLHEHSSKYCKRHYVRVKCGGLHNRVYPGLRIWSQSPETEQCKQQVKLASTNKQPVYKKHDIASVSTIAPPTVSTNTGYADAVKRNTTHTSEDNYILGKFLKS